ncbi:MAG: D-glycero-alpha-D-manno-heptose-1,7-bisphosphate 7-phosphatase [Draconibacterium sp.]
MQEKTKRKALFLDRDGTINIDKDYLFRIEDFEFQPGIFDLIRSYSDQDYLIFIITNQSGIARGYYTENDYFQLTQWMTEQLRTNGIHVEKVYHCSHHPEITGSCTCRKPKPGLIVQALKEYPVDPERSVLIGDKERDILAGQNAGTGKNLYIQPLLKKGVF